MRSAQIVSSEDDEDVAIYDARKAELAEENTFPAALSMALYVPADWLRS